MRPSSNLVYCSLDLELSGFDPARDAILEVGFTFFRLGQGNLEIEEQWTQVFNSGFSVHPKILGLTGISQEELDAAPPLAEFRDFLSGKLKDVILVGHNIIVDIKFLQAAGILVDSRSVDTLDLVQFLLPTRHSYNLENLMHYFQIPHPKAHRALADSTAVIQVLERLLLMFAALPQQLKHKMLGLVRREEFEWMPLLLAAQDWQGESAVDNKPGKEKISSELSQIDPAPLKSLPQNSIALLPFGQENLASIARAVQASLKSGDKALLAISSKTQVLDLWQRGLVRGVFAPEDQFNQEKFDQFLSFESLSREQIQFALKVMVWQATNWQTDTILDLNLSFSGGQFRSAITGSLISKELDEPVLACDYSTLLFLASHGHYRTRQLIVHNMHAFEQELASGKERRLSWNRMVYLLKNLSVMEAEADQTVLTEALAATDLFFGLLSLTLQRHFSGTYVKVSDLAEEQFYHNKIQQALERYLVKLELVQQEFQSPELPGMISFLSSFMEPSDSHIKWMEVRENNCLLYNQPLHLEITATQSLHKFTSVTLTETFPDPLLTYFMKRLGLNLPIEPMAGNTKNKPVPMTVLPARTGTALVEQLNILLQPECLPAAVIMGSTAAIKDFYNRSYQVLKRHAALYAQGYSGGSNKLLRNYAIKSSSILLVTGQLLARNALHQIPAKTLIIADLPRENPDHPYIQALKGYWQHEFAQIELLLDTVILLAALAAADRSGLKHIYLMSGPKGQEDRTDLLRSLTVQLGITTQ